MKQHEYELINKFLEDNSLEHLKCKNLYKRKYSEVVAILNIFFNLTGEQKELFMPLLTTIVWQSSPENIRLIIYIFTKIYKGKNERQKELFMPILSPNIWNCNLENMMAIMESNIWENSLYRKLLSKSIWNKSITRIENTIKAMEELKLERYITPSCFNLLPIQIKALYHYMGRNNIPVILNGKLNPIYNVAPSTMLKRYGINLGILVEKEKERVYK